MGVELPPLGGRDNAQESRQDDMVRQERMEGKENFFKLKERFQKQSVRIFVNVPDFMTLLREDTVFQNLKREGGFDDEDAMKMLAREFSQDLDERFELEDPKQQAALLANLMQLDYLQDERLRQKGMQERRQAAVDAYRDEDYREAA